MENTKEVLCANFGIKNAIIRFNCEKDPWTFEKDNDSKNYVYLIATMETLLGIIRQKWFGIRKGKWCKERLF